MPVYQTFIVEIFACVDVLVGFLVNIFIMGIYLRYWWASKKLKPYDKILANLGLSRVLLLFCLFLRIIIRIFNWTAYPSPTQRCIFRTVQLLFEYASLWFAMWLCLLYFVKISILKNNFLLWVKLRIPKLIPPIIIITYVASFIFAFIFAFFIKETADVMDNVNLPANESVYEELNYMIPSYFFGHVLPFIFVTISTSLLIHTIALHIIHIRSNITGFTRPRFDAHLSVIRSAVLLELMTICNLLATFIFRFDFYGHFDTNVSFLFLVSYPLLHSLVIIAGNAKLRGVLLRVWGCVKAKIATERCPKKQKRETKRETVWQQK
uniref:Taste receptor type 2 n=1 Tax=Pyxicephalus adspersus TaxID=30357 RepID=A0AAV3AM14_PYXAD|nr:TPA: hypothetical protein GDO54_009871 [Pyxicephalus adspersus]